MPYVDGFITPVPADKIADYKKIARACGRIWKEHGALTYVECLGDDTPVGKWTSFPRAVKLKEGEVVVFSWITYASKKQRDATMKKVMADPRLQKMMGPGKMPFDTRRMIFGGFKSMIEM